MARYRNPGRLPDDADGTDEGKTFHVHVELFGGWSSRKAGHAPWPADRSNWKIRKPPHPFDIEFYEVE